MVLEVDGQSLDDVILLDQAVLASLEQDHPHKPGTLYHLFRMYQSRYRHDPTHCIDDLLSSIDVGEQTLAAVSPSDTGKNRIAHSLAQQYYEKFLKTNNGSSIDQAVKYSLLAVECTPVVDVGPKLQMMISLGDMYTFRNEKTNSIEDAYHALSVYQEVAVDGHPGLSGIERVWPNTATVCLMLLEFREIIEQPGPSIQALQDILLSMTRLGIQDDKTRSTIELTLSVLLLTRYDKSKTLDDLDASIQLRHQVHDRKDPAWQANLERELADAYFRLGEHSLSLAKVASQTLKREDLLLAIGLADRYENFSQTQLASEVQNRVSLHATTIAGRVQETMFDMTKDLNAIKEAVRKACSALRLTEGRIERRQDCIKTLCVCYAKQIAVTDPVPSLLEMIESFDTMLPKNTTAILSASQRQYDQAEFLMILHNELGHLDALDEALRKYQNLSTFHDDLEEQILQKLSIAAVKRYRYQHHAEDLQLALDSARAALSLHQADDALKANLIEILANLTSESYLRDGRLQDLHDSISLCQDALRLSNESNKDRILMNLGNKYRYRFENLGAGEDIAKALDCCKQALRDETGSDSKLLTKKLNNYGVVLRLAYGHTLQARYLDESIEQGERLQNISENMRPGIENLHWKSNLGISLSKRAIIKLKSGDIANAQSDAMRAIVLTRATLQLAITLKSIPLQAAMQNNLGNRLALLSQIDVKESEQWLSQAIHACTEAFRLTSKDHPAYTYRVRNLANYTSLINRKRGTEQSQELVDLYLSAFQNPSGTVGDRFLVLSHLTDCLVYTNNFPKLMIVLNTALKLLPAFHIRGLRRANQQQRLRVLSNLAASSTAAALQTGQSAYSALGKFEEARMMIFSSEIDRRTEDELLRSKRPDLHKDMHDQQAILNTHAEAMADIDGYDLEKSSNFAHARIQASMRMVEVIDQIRGVDGLQYFRRFPPEREVKAMAEKGPIVAINVTSFRADAIIVTTSAIEAIELPRLLLSEAKHQRISLQTALHAAARDGQANTRHANKVLGSHLRWLWEAFVGDIIQKLYEWLPSSVAGEPRVWWMPCDILSTFPIHAAGIFRNGRSSVSAADSVISSYTPTIKSLLYARTKSNDTRLGLADDGVQSDQVTIVGVSMPDTPTESPVRYSQLKSEEEMDGIASQIGPDWTFSRLRSPNRELVLEQISKSSIIHFACHGRADQLDPSNSCLLLTDHLTRPLIVKSIESLQLDRSRLAYLSACHSAVSLSEVLAGEAITIASAFQLAGIPSVIGTLWQALDHGAVETAKSFYDNLDRSWQERRILDGRTCAEALHKATLQRRKVAAGNFLDWASWVHVGD